MAANRQEPIYQQICLVVQQIPPGRVATYGQIAAIVGGCTARMVGYAMATLDGDTPTPWQRVINAQGKVSPRADSESTARQRELLQREGVLIDASGRIDLRRYRWRGPRLDWLLEEGFDPTPSWREE